MEAFPLIMSFLVLVGLVLLLPMLTCTRRASAKRELEPLWQKNVVESWIKRGQVQLLAEN